MEIPLTESHSSLLMSELVQNKNPTKAVSGNAFCGNQDFIKVVCPEEIKEFAQEIKLVYYSDCGKLQ